MALVTTTITAVERYNPYERPPDELTLRTAIPRGLRYFTSTSQTLDAKPVNDQQLLIVTGELPSNYAYVMADVMLGISQDVADDWSRNVRLNLRNFLPGLPGIDGDWMLSWEDVSGGDGRAALQPASVVLPRFPLRRSQELGTVGFSLIARNSAAAVGAAGVVRAYISFYEYDLAQIQYFPANFAPNVQIR